MYIHRVSIKSVAPPPHISQTAKNDEKPQNTGLIISKSYFFETIGKDISLKGAPGGTQLRNFKWDPPYIGTSFGNA